MVGDTVRELISQAQTIGLRSEEGGGSREGCVRHCWQVSGESEEQRRGRIKQWEWSELEHGCKRRAERREQ